MAQPYVKPTIMAIGLKGFHPSAVILVFYKPLGPGNEMELKESLLSKNEVESVRFQGWHKDIAQQTIEFSVPVSMVAGIHVFDLELDAAEIEFAEMSDPSAPRVLEGYSENISKIHGIMNEGVTVPLPWMMASAVHLVRPTNKEG